MNQLKRTALVRWFASCGERYLSAYLSHLDVARLAGDPDYGLKQFLFLWAFERSGAPRGYRIAAVKAVSSNVDRKRGIAREFRTLYGGKLNVKGNPALDPRIEEVDVPAVVNLVTDGAVADAFISLDLKGLGHKLKSFFLRDLVVLFGVEDRLGQDVGAHLWCQPVDIWVRKAAEELMRGKKTESAAQFASHYGLNREDFAVAHFVIVAALEAGVSPLMVNQGVWYFCANVAADDRQLRRLLRSGNTDQMDRELALLDGFLPVSPSWGAA